MKKYEIIFGPLNETTNKIEKTLHKKVFKLQAHNQDLQMIIF